jgi:hypothetical protein
MLGPGQVDSVIFDGPSHSDSVRRPAVRVTVSDMTVTDNFPAVNDIQITRHRAVTVTVTLTVP